MTSVLTGSEQTPVNVSIVPKPMDWELQRHHRLIPNEFLQARLDENSCDDILTAWLPRGVVFSSWSASAILNIFTLPTDYLHALRTATRSMTKPLAKQPHTKLSSQWRGSLFKVGWLISFKWIAFEVPENPTRRLPTHNPDCNLPSSSYIDDDDQSGKYNDFQSLIWYWWPEKVTSPVVFVT